MMDEFSPGPSSNLRAASPLRIGLLVDSTMATPYVYDFTQWAQSHEDLVVTHLFLRAPPKLGSGSRLAVFLRRLVHSANRHGLYFALSEFAFFIVERFEQAIIKRNKRHSEHLRRFDLSSIVENTITISPIVSTSGLDCHFDTIDIQRVKDLDLDLLLKCGTSSLRGEILNSSKFGIISVHPGDNRIIRGAPGGFWEVYLRQETTGFTIQRLTEDSEAGDVLMRGHFATRHYYTLNQAFVYRKSFYYLKTIIEKLALTRRLPEFVPNYPYSLKLFRRPAAHESCAYLAKLFHSMFIKKLRHIFGVHYRWNVAYVQRDWRDAELWRGIKLKNAPNHCLADPFVICRNQRNYCFVEDLDYLKRRGSIAVYELTDAGGIRVGTALDEDFHLSFPYLFQYRGELYMCPESSENRDIRIYKCLEFPLQWKLEKIVMEKISAVDTMIFQRDGKWWMFTNIDPAEIGDHCSELFIFSADSPLATSWTPHPLNPIMVDASRARNAGCVVDGEDYYRFSQGQGFDFYGKRVLVNKIAELTETTYRESCSSVIAPSFGNGAVGTHHLHSNGKITAFDFATSSRVETEDNS